MRECECRSLKHAYAHVYIDFLLEAAAQTGISMPGQVLRVQEHAIRSFIYMYSSRGVPTGKARSGSKVLAESKFIPHPNSFSLPLHLSLQVEIYGKIVSSDPDVNNP